MKTLWEKEKLLETSNFSFFNSVFYPFEELSAIFIKFEIVICKLFQFESVWNLSFGKGLKHQSIKKSTNQPTVRPKQQLTERSTHRSIHRDHDDDDSDDHDHHAHDYYDNDPNNNNNYHDSSINEDDDAKNKDDNKLELSLKVMN